MIGIQNMSYEQYDAIEGVSKHGLDAFARSPLHHWAYYRNPEKMAKKETAANILGSAIHVSILEPERFDHEYVQEPNPHDYLDVLDTADDYKAECKKLGLKVTGTKPVLKAAMLAAGVSPARFWDDIYTKATGARKVLSQGDWRVTKAITARVRKHPAASAILQNGKAERSIFWVDQETGVQCKGRLDWLAYTGRYLIFDLKSTLDASPAGFQRSIAKYRYYVQAAMYMDAAEANGLNPEAFVFGAWEKHAPYASALYYAPDDMLEAGRTEYRKLLKSYATCLESDVWPGYSNEIQAISLPEYFKENSSQSELDEDWLTEMVGE